jgi:hypothetical protein
MTKYYFKHYRIQDGKAIIAFILNDETPVVDGGRLLQWVGDAYELRDRLNVEIEILEDR